MLALVHREPDTLQATVQALDEDAPASTSVPIPMAAQPAESLSEKLLGLNKLKEQGILTDEEFAAAKAKTLSMP